MSKNKTTETEKSVSEFIDAVKDDIKRKDCHDLIEILKKQTNLEPKMWGPSIVGFGRHHYKYESGREGDSPNFAFSPRASSIALYFCANFEDREELLKKFGKHKTDKGCIHIKTLSDIEKSILIKMVTNHIMHMKDLYPDLS